MIIEISEKIIEIKADEGLFLKDEDSNVFEGICFRNDGQTEDEIKGLYTEITAEEKAQLEELDEEELEIIEDISDLL